MGAMMKTKLLAASLLAFSTSALAGDKSPPPEPASHPDWVSVREQGLSKLTTDLFDPDSAVINWRSGFAWGFVKPIIGRRTYVWVACGTLNAKNRYGGYVGAKQFWIAADANGAVTANWVDETMSSCDKGTGVPVNPELKNLSSNMPVANSATISVADELEKLANLRDKGVITPEEFDQQKARLLAR
jgi:hypothetical protein